MIHSALKEGREPSCAEKETIVSQHISEFWRLIYAVIHNVEDDPFSRFWYCGGGWTKVRAKEEASRALMKPMKPLWRKWDLFKLSGRLGSLTGQ